MSRRAFHVEEDEYLKPLFNANMSETRKEKSLCKTLKTLIVLCYVCEE
jgi:hypothetical protein